MNATRRVSRQVAVGPLVLGGGAPIVVQSMTNTDTADVQATLAQINNLHNLGCELIRVAVPDKRALAGLREVCSRSPLPVVADIHYDHTLALAAIDAGVAKLRINPGTLGSEKAVAQVAATAVAAGIPIRVGVNSGSIHSRYRHLDRVRGLVSSALHYCGQLENSGCTDIVVSLKSSSVRETHAANREFAARTDYPLHLGVTEAGTLSSSTIKSAIGIGSLLLEGIGDTLRVSVTGSPEKEIPVALNILRALGLREGIEIISCPTCGRTEIDVAAVAEKLENLLDGKNIKLSVAVMGCPVNGPGEARHADMGIAFGAGTGVFFRRGKIVATMDNAQLPDALLQAVEEEIHSARRGC